MTPTKCQNKLAAYYRRVVTHIFHILSYISLFSQNMLSTLTRGPRGPWNAHLRQKIFKSSLFSLLYVQQATPWRSKSKGNLKVMFVKEFSKI